jgi:broad specificity phosphatase PhoE
MNTQMTCETDFFNSAECVDTDDIRKLDHERNINTGKGKLFLLRHEQRGRSISYRSSLTDEGLSSSILSVAPRLETIGIDVIYCSPFLRTLQTIRPFCERSGIKINIEWSLVESIPKDTDVDQEFSPIINKEYTSFTPYEELNASSVIDFDILKKRIIPFVKSLDCSKNTLLVTHMPVINAILSYIKSVDIDMYTHVHPGSIISIDFVY